MFLWIKLHDHLWTETLDFLSEKEKTCSCCGKQFADFFTTEDSEEMVVDSKEHRRIIKRNINQRASVHITPESLPFHLLWSSFRKISMQFRFGQKFFGIHFLRRGLWIKLCKNSTRWDFWFQLELSQVDWKKWLLGFILFLQLFGKEIKANWHAAETALEDFWRHRRKKVSQVASLGFSIENNSRFSCDAYLRKDCA